jgi:nucleotide-binding universal stress UspA family protein
MQRNATKFAPAAFRALRPYSALKPMVPAARYVSIRRDASLNPSALQQPSADLTFREVIVPLDGSPYAEHALPWAIQFAALAGGRVRLVHVHQQMQPAFHGRRLELYREFDRLLREPMEEYMADVTRRLGRATSVPVSPMLVDRRHVAESLAELVASSADIVVMATRGRNVVSRALVGSALDAVLQRREAPILHVRGYSCPVDFTARPALRHALVSLDVTSESENVLRSLAAISKLTDSRQTLLRVVESSGLFSLDDETQRDGARELRDNPVAQLDDVADAWRSELPRLRTSVVWSDGGLVHEILRQGEEQGADFIAMATRPRGRLSRLLRPGVFDRLIRRARLPILVAKQA